MGRMPKPMTGGRGAVTDAASELKKLVREYFEKARTVTPSYVAGDDTFVFSEGGRSFSFFLPNETANSINLDMAKVYGEETRKLHEAARSVRSQSLFGKREGGISEILKKLVERYSFVPFKYQIENVLAVLTRFDGKAVLGDQVGLGKTVEALMTADAMFACGVIRNALIIVPKRMLEDWVHEIDSKFGGVFDLRNRSIINYYLEHQGGGFGSFFSGTIEMMMKDNAAGVGGPNIYIIIDEMIGENVSFVRRSYEQHNYINNIINAELMDADVAALGRPIEGDVPADSPLLGEIERRVRAIKSPGLNANNLVAPILREYGYPINEDGSVIDFEERLRTVSSDLENKTSVLSAMNREKCRLLRGILERHKRRIASGARPNDRIQYRNSAEYDISRIEEWINGVEAEFERRTERFDESLLAGLFRSGSERLVDLLIVDEVHSFYNSNNTKNVAEDSFDVDEQLFAVNLLSEMKKKFCVLMSATPVRTRLEDVFDLVWIADKDRFGTGREAALNYFYTTMCRLPVNARGTVDEKYKLSMMIDSPERRKSFFGLINNFFTRKRIFDVKEDMKGEEILYSKYTDGDTEKHILDAAMEDIEKRYALIHHQSNLYGDPYECAEKAVKKWRRSGADDYGFVGASVNRELIDYIEGGRFTSDIDLDGGKERNRTAHRMINWNRRGKSGILVEVDDRDARPHSGAGGGASTYDAASAIAAMYRMREESHTDAEARRMLKLIGVGEKEISSSELAPADLLTEKWDDFIFALEYEPVLIFDSRIDPSDPEGATAYSNELIDRLRDALDIPLVANNAAIIDNSKRKFELNPGIEHRITDECYNQVSIVDRSYQAGVNLQQYRFLLFSQMDADGKRLLEPVDIEQWIGRVHRTGQVKDCLIVTVPVTNMAVSPEPDFLKWYYSVLSDPEGLDLYGNNTPDVAFVQPIVVDQLKKFLTYLRENERYGSKKFSNLLSSERLQLLGKGQRVDDLTFSQLLEVCYHYDKATFETDGGARGELVLSVEEMIREICRTDGLGKRA